MNIILIIVLIGIVSILFWALFGDRGDKSSSDSSADRLPDKTFRRRSTDQEIEEKFPDAKMPGGIDRRQAQPYPDREDSIDLPYDADDIIPESSRFRIYRRTLVNSEIYAKKGDLSTAISLYDGVRSRIHDAETKFKIEANIEYLKYYKKKKEEIEKKKKDDVRRRLDDEAAAPGITSQLKLTVDGAMPGKINIGVIDLENGFNADKIAAQITARFKNEIDGLKNEIEELKKTPAGRQSGPGLEGELSAIKNRLDELDETARPRSGAGEDAVPDKNLIDGLNRQITDLSKKLAGLAQSRVDERGSGKMPVVVESDQKPVIIEAKYDSPIPITMDPKPLLEILEKIPRQNVPSPVDLKKPDYASMKPTSSEERVTRKETVEEGDDNEFELLSEYGRDRAGENLSDEEIFEKILKDAPQQDASFEIRGDKKELFDEFSMTDEELTRKRTEEDSFYRKLLRTDKRKRRELPILKVSYDFTRLPDEISLSKEKNIIEYAFYKYKPMLEKADEYIKKRKVRDALNYYRVVMNQNIPPEFKAMIRRNINDLTEYLEKYLTGE